MITYIDIFEINCKRRESGLSIYDSVISNIVEGWFLLDRLFLSDRNMSNNTISIKCIINVLATMKNPKA